MLDPNSQPLALPPSVADSNYRNPLALTSYAQALDPGAGPALGPAAAPTVAGLLHALRRRWLLAGSLGFLGAFSAILAVLTFFPAQFDAHTRIQVASRPGPTLFTPGIPSEDSDFLIFKASMASLIKSPLVINAALNQVKDLAMIRELAKPIPWLEKHLKTDYLLAPETLRVSLSGDRAEEVAKVINAVTDAFMKEMVNQEKAKRELRLDQLKDNLTTVKRDLEQKRTAFRTEINKGKLDDPEVSKARFMAALTDLNSAKTLALNKHLEQLKAQQNLKNIESTLKDLSKVPVSDLQIDLVMKQNPVAQEMLKQIGETAKHIQDVRTASNKNRLTELLAPLKAKLADQQKQLAELRKQLRPDLEKSIRQDYGDKLEQDKFQLLDTIDSLKKQEESLSREVQQREDEANRLKNNPLPPLVMVMKDDILSMENAQTKLKDMIASLKSEAVSARVTLLQQAEVPTSREYGRQLKFVGVAGLGAFGLMLLGVSWWEFRARRINAADEVVQGLRMSLVGTLPALPLSARRPQGQGSSPRDLQWQNQLTEAVDGIRTLLLHSARTEALQVVMVTSAMNGEGKTSLASQLAASLARAWRKTLLVAGDLRNPGAHKLFGLAQEPGLSEVLRGEVPAADTIRPTPIGRLWLMPAGHWDSHAIQALAQEGVREMFSRLKEQYDFVIVDSCPVLPVADSLLLGQHVDAVIFSILRDVSRVPTVYSAQQRLNNLGIRTLGAVVIGDRASNSAVAAQYQAKATT